VLIDGTVATDDAGKKGREVMAKMAVAVGVRTASVRVEILRHIWSTLGQQNISITYLNTFENIHINGARNFNNN